VGLSPCRFPPTGQSESHWRKRRLQNIYFVDVPSPSRRNRANQWAGLDPWSIPPNWTFSLIGKWVCHPIPFFSLLLLLPLALPKRCYEVPCLKRLTNSRSRADAESIIVSAGPRPCCRKKNDSLVNNIGDILPNVGRLSGTMHPMSVRFVGNAQAMNVSNNFLSMIGLLV
jgi:hypothetical protein